MITESFPAVKRPRRDVDHPPPPSTEVQEGVYVYNFTPSLGFHGLLWGEIYFERVQ
jgi:hypothetical protein